MVTSRGCGAVSVIDPASAATAELLTLLLLNRGVTIDPNAARCLPGHTRQLAHHGMTVIAGILVRTHGARGDSATFTG